MQAILTILPGVLNFGLKIKTLLNKYCLRHKKLFRREGLLSVLYTSHRRGFLKSLTMYIFSWSRFKKEVTERGGLFQWPIFFILTLRIGPRRDLAFSTLKLNWVKARGQIFSDQNGYCLFIHFYVFYFFQLLRKQ